jgi:ATP-dependent DNA helicase PIF1
VGRKYAPHLSIYLKMDVCVYVAGLPPHRLLLNVGFPIILLWNLDSPKLCNGTRLCVKKMLGNVIEVTVLTGTGEGETVFIPWIPLILTDLPFNFKRLQFPVRLVFEISINKSQGSLLSTAEWI